MSRPSTSGDFALPVGANSAKRFQAVTVDQTIPRVVYISSLRGVKKVANGARYASVLASFAISASSTGHWL